MCHTGVYVQARRINAIRTFTLDAQPWSETLVIIFPTGNDWT